MCVTVDQSPLATEEIGLHTVGQLLSHLQKRNRLVVQVLIDGQQPDLTHMAAVRRSPLDGHNVFVETADPRQMATTVLDAIEEQLRQTETLRIESADLLRQNQIARAMEKLAGCFSGWEGAQESMVATAQLMRLDLQSVTSGGRALRDLLSDFAEQLRQIKSTLECHDFVGLGDILTYETEPTRKLWRGAIDALRQRIAA